MMLGTLVDTDALWHVAVYALGGGAVFISAFAVAVYARDRAARGGVSGGAVVWNIAMGAALAACLAVFALGIWAMTQKPG
jgi:hypothetical protein